MRKLKYIILAVVFTSLFNSCEDYLERVPLDSVNTGAIINSPKDIEAVLMHCYSYMPYGLTQRTDWETDGHAKPTNNMSSGNISILDCTTDQLVNKSGWAESWVAIESGFTPFGPPAEKHTRALHNWENAYRGINEINKLIEDILDKSDAIPDDVRKFRAEAEFMRAVMYLDIARRYGDAPLITEVLNVYSEDPADYNKPRTPVNEIYDFIDEELMKAAEVLPMSSEVLEFYGVLSGRPTKEACWAYNGRMNLHAERYARSAEMSKKVIDAVKDGSSNHALSPDYKALFVNSGGDPEAIFEIMATGLTNQRGTPVDNLNRPPSKPGSWGGQWNPTQNMVDAYEMKNGLPITDPASGYDPNDPYKDRDPRLDASILHHGSEFMGEVMDLSWYLMPGYNADSTEIISYQWFPLTIDGAHQMYLSSITGYYILKFMDETLPIGAEFGDGTQSWKDMRLAEVYLNYAEAQNEAVGPDASVYEAINTVRARPSVNMPQIESGLDQAGMFERIQRERMVELAFEGTRFWDIRRWRIGAEVYADGYMKCGYPLKFPDGTMQYMYDGTEVDDTYDGKPVTVFQAANTTAISKSHIWDDKNYLMPIPQEEIDLNPFITGNNPGY